MVTDANGKPFSTSTPLAYGPADLWSAYKLSPSNGAPGSGPTVAVVDAFDNPNAESDLAAYRQAFGLGDCTTANGCFKKVNQRGVQGSYPKGDVGWGEEIALDLDMVSAICPNCKILLVEADSNTYANLGAGVNMAAALGAVAISNSYGAGEFALETSYDGYYTHPGLAITASSGDSGYGVEYPAASANVTAVGGTSLTQAGNVRGWAEAVWSGAGAGCSAYIAKPSWQHDAGCGRRTVADVSAVADPNTGVAVYDTYGTGGTWLIFGGTSVGSPIVASIYALAGNAVTGGVYPYSNAGALFDVTSGSDGHCRRTYLYLCTGVAGYDGPSGLGTPNGIGAF